MNLRYLTGCVLAGVVAATALAGSLVLSVAAHADASTSVSKNATSLTDPYYTLVNQNSGKCLVIGGSSTANGAPAAQWTCLNIEDQHWYLNSHA